MRIKKTNQNIWLVYNSTSVAEYIYFLFRHSALHYFDSNYMFDIILVLYDIESS